MIDLTGEQYGRLTVLNEVYDKQRKGSRSWLCRCSCGNLTIKSQGDLRSGDTKSCGCYHSECVRNQMSTHGKSKTRLYRVWAGMKNRCFNANAVNYKYYGAKGITVCSEWANSFEAFEQWANENGYNKAANINDCTLDRIDCEKGYSPDNCRWVNHYVQCNNQSANKNITYNEKTHTIAEWARIAGIKYSTLKSRLRNGIPFERAIDSESLKKKPI